MPEIESEEIKEENVESTHDEDQTNTETVTGESQQANTETIDKSEKSKNGSSKSHKKASEKKEKQSDAKKSKQKTDDYSDNEDAKSDDIEEEPSEQNENHQEDTDKTETEKTDSDDNIKADDQIIEETSSEEKSDETIPSEETIDESSESETANYNNTNDINKEGNIMPENTNEEQKVDPKQSNLAPDSSKDRYEESSTRTVENDYAQPENTNEATSEWSDAATSANETADYTIPSPETGEDDPVINVKDSKTYTINGTEYSEEDIGAMRDELASRTAQDNDVSTETARKALDNGKYAEGYAADHPDEITQEAEELNTDTPDLQGPRLFNTPEQSNGPLVSDNIGVQPANSATDNITIQTVAGADIDPGFSINPPAGIGGGLGGNWKWITQEDTLSPENMSTEQLQEIVASADAIDGRGTKESNMKALQGDYWQYADEQEAQDETQNEASNEESVETEDEADITDVATEPENSDEYNGQQQNMPNNHGPENHGPEGHGPVPEPEQPGMNGPDAPFMGDNGFSPMYHMDESEGSQVQSENNGLGSQIVNGVEQGVPGAAVVIPVADMSPDDFQNLQDVLGDIMNTDGTDAYDDDLNATVSGITEEDNRKNSVNSGIEAPADATVNHRSDSKPYGTQAEEIFGSIENYEAEEGYQKQ